MTLSSKPQSKRGTPASPHWLGSLCATVFGWLCLNGFVLCAGVAEGQRLADSFAALPGFAFFSLAFIFPVWLVVLLPLYLLVPTTRKVWRWPILSFAGALAGAAINYGYDLVLGGSIRSASDAIYVLLPGALTGSTTCLFGALTVQWFIRAKHAGVLRSKQARVTPSKRPWGDDPY